MSSRCPVITDRSGIAVAALSTPPERCVPSYMERVVILTIVAPKRHLPWQQGLELDELVYLDNSIKDGQRRMGSPDVFVGHFRPGSSSSSPPRVSMAMAMRAPGEW